jgi:molybdopterin synthase catalytic subunit
MSVKPDIRVQTEPFDVATEQHKLCAGRTDIGGIVAFTGICRDEGGALEALELEHFPGMAEAELGRVADQAIARWPLMGLTIIHRHGRITPGEDIVLAIAASAHRRAAFEAADFMMDFLKTRAPFWKKEHLKAGTEGSWVAAKSEDDDAAARW